MRISTSISPPGPAACRRLVRALFLSSLFSTNAGAYDWSNDYGVFLTLEYDDNFRLTEDDPVETTSANLALSGELRGADEVSSVLLGIRATGTTYSESTIENSEDYQVYFTGKRRRSERWLGTLDASYGLSPTTESELLDTGNRVDGERRALNIAPGFSYQLSERNSIYLDLMFVDVSYDTVSLTGYTDNSVSAGWIHSVSEISDISLNGQVSEYHPEDNDITTVSGVNLGYEISTSDATRYSLRLGYADSDSPTGSERDGNSSFEIQHRLDERNSFSLFAGNGFEGSGAGEVRYTSRLNMRWDHAIAERSQFFLSSNGSRTEDRDYIEVVVGGSNQLTRELGISVSYRYRNQRSEFEDANSNSILFSLSYSPVSRWSHEL